MPRMRGRDVRAILFCLLTAIALFVVAYLLSRSYLASVALTGGYVAWLLTRPRMQRVMRRLNGAPDWSGYYRDE